MKHIIILVLMFLLTRIYNLQMLGVLSTPVQHLGALSLAPTPVMSAYSHPGLMTPATSPLMITPDALPPASKQKSVWDKLIIRKPALVSLAALPLSALTSTLTFSHALAPASVPALASFTVPGLAKVLAHVDPPVLVVEHKTVQPSFAVFTEVADVFSFCTVEYQKEAKIFIQKALQ